MSRVLLVGVAAALDVFGFGSLLIECRRERSGLALPAVALACGSAAFVIFASLTG